MHITLPPHEHLLTLGAVLKPSLDQSGLSARVFQQNVEKRQLGKLVLGMWFLLLIVLGSEYKSEVTSAVVVPNFKKPPATFRQLAESDYKIFAVFWARNLEVEFETMNSNYSNAFTQRVQKRNYFEKDASFHSCYAQGTVSLIGVKFAAAAKASSLQPQPHVKLHINLWMQTWRFTTKTSSLQPRLKWLRTRPTFTQKRQEWLQLRRIDGQTSEMIIEYV